MADLRIAHLLKEVVDSPVRVIQIIVFEIDGSRQALMFLTARNQIRVIREIVVVIADINGSTSRIQIVITFSQVNDYLGALLE